MAIKDKREFLTGMSVCLFSLVIIQQALQIPKLHYESTLSPSFFPLLLAGLLLLCGLAIVVDSFKEQAKQETAIKQISSGRRLMLFIFVATVVYLMLMEAVGFTLSTFIFLAFLLFYLKGLDLSRSLIVAALVDLSVWLMFARMFKVALPAGRIWGW